MPVEPEHSIEDQLRAYADGRRLEAPRSFDLDESARRRLHHEVRRVYLANEPAPTATLSTWFWTRLTLVGASAAVLLLVSLQFRAREQEVLLSQAKVRPIELAALTESAEPAELAPPDAEPTGLAPTPARHIVAPEPSAAPSAPAAALRPNEVLDLRGPAGGESGRREAAPLSRQQPTALPEVDRSGIVATEISEGAANREARLAVSMEPLRSEFDAAAYGIPADAEFAARGGAPGSQRFQQIQQYRRNPNSPEPPPVLQSFRWIRQGDAVQIIDADGSVYTGEMEARPIAAGGERRDSLAAAPRDSFETRGNIVPRLRQATPDQAGIGESFFVLGTNRTLNVRVEFEGVLLPQAASSPVTSTIGTTQPAAAAPVNPQIQGQALIGDATRLGIQAAPPAE